MRNRLLCLAVLLAAGPAFAQAPGPRQLTLRPAAEPVPALKYQLLPPVSEQISGNAAPGYLRALIPSSLWHRRDKENDAKLERWRQAPLDALPRDEMAWLVTYRPLLDCDLAARHTFADFDMPERLRRDGAMTPVGEFQDFRDLVRLLAVRARLEMAAGQHDKAVRTFQTAFMLSRHASEAPLLITSLIGSACAKITLDQVETFIQTPDAPNLYWALTALPRPFIDLHRGLQGERFIVAHLFPQGVDLETTPLTAAQLEHLRTKGDELLNVGVEGPKPWAELFDGKTDLASALAKMYPEARQTLLAQGLKAKDLDAMPKLQVVVIDVRRQLERIQDDAMKLSHLPYWQARPRLLALEKQVKTAKRPAERIAGLLVAGVNKVPLSAARLDRQIAALRCIEALRLYAAAHDGKLPAKLADLTEVPVPLDPISGKEFEYKVEGDKVTLFGAPPAGDEAQPANTLRYDLVFKK